MTHWTHVGRVTPEQVKPGQTAQEAAERRAFHHGIHTDGEATFRLVPDGDVWLIQKTDGHVEPDASDGAVYLHRHG